MTKAEIKVLREQSACRECQDKRERDLTDPENLNNHTSRSRLALGNSMVCDNCLILVQVRFSMSRASRELES